MSNELGTDVAFLSSIFLVELSAVLLEVAADLALLLLGEQRARAWPPEELLEAVEDVLLELLSLEVPDGVAVLNLQSNVSCRTT